MEARELRIGNYVFEDYGGVYVVREIRENKILISKSKKAIAVGYKKEEIIPIPLTEEWLLKFGYSITTSNSAGKRYSKVVKGVFAADLSLTYWDTTIDAGKIFRMDRYIKHVHQLQNLYFALTGEELTLNQ